MDKVLPVSERSTLPVSLGSAPTNASGLELLSVASRRCTSPCAEELEEPTASSGVLAVAVPQGTVTLYSSRLWHRGGANRSDRERTFCFLTVSEPDAPAPAGLIHTMERDEVGGWMLDHRGLRATSEAKR